MFLYKTRHADIGRIHACNTRGADVFSFVPERYNKNSPYYEGSILWDELPVVARRAGSMMDFRKAIAGLYRTYDPNVI